MRAAAELNEDKAADLGDVVEMQVRDEEGRHGLLREAGGCERANRRRPAVKHQQLVVERDDLRRPRAPGVRPCRAVSLRGEISASSEAPRKAWGNSGPLRRERARCFFRRIRNRPVRRRRYIRAETCAPQCRQAVSGAAWARSFPAAYARNGLRPTSAWARWPQGPPSVASESGISGPCRRTRRRAPCPWYPFQRRR